MVSEFCYLGGIPFETGPEEIRWTFSMKAIDQKTMGGKVVQILGTSLGDMTLRGRFGRGKGGDEPTWDQMMRMRDQVKEWAATDGDNPIAVRFQYLPRNWDFEVFIKALEPFQLTNLDVAPVWQLTLHINQSSAEEVVTDIKDMYLKRLMEGVGWTQTDYNGPMGDITDVIGDMTAGEYLEARVQYAFESGLPGGTSASDPRTPLF